MERITVWLHQQGIASSAILIKFWTILHLADGRKISEYPTSSPKRPSSTRATLLDRREELAIAIGSSQGDIGSDEDSNTIGAHPEGGPKNTER